MRFNKETTYDEISSLTKEEINSLTNDEIQFVVENDPWAASDFLYEKLTAQQIDLIVNDDPYAINVNKELFLLLSSDQKNKIINRNLELIRHLVKKRISSEHKKEFAKICSLKANEYSPNSFSAMKANDWARYAENLEESALTASEFCMSAVYDAILDKYPNGPEAWEASEIARAKESASQVSILYRFAESYN